MNTATTDQEQQGSTRLSFPGLTPIEQTYEKFSSLAAARHYVYNHPDPHFGAVLVPLDSSGSEKWYMVAPMSADVVGKYDPKNSCLILRSPQPEKSASPDAPASKASPVATAPKAKRSAENGVCARAREIYIEMGDERTKPEFIQRCIDAGINKSTAGVRWLKCNREFGNA